MGKLLDAVEAHNPAFPLTAEFDGVRVGWWGMSQRDYFAAAALTGILAASKGDVDPEIDSAMAYRYADAMLAAGKVAK